MIGPPGTGKTMLAKRMPTILPDLNLEEAIEVTKIHSASGLLPHKIALLTTRPFRFPHHTISYTALIGGGTFAKPGEVSLAHQGVLFLDELPEFNKNVLEVLRQPLENGTITISRISASFTYPSQFMLVAAMNPCQCGYYTHPSKECRCTLVQVQKYRHKISGPLLDRIDIHIEVPPISYTELSSTGDAETSESIREKVRRAREVQKNRFDGTKIRTNSQMTSKYIRKYCKLDENMRNLLKMAIDKLGLSARAYDRILKVSRTIADLEEKENIEISHLSEAIQYRSLDRPL